MMLFEWTIVFIVSFVFIGFIRRKAPLWGLVDVPDRKRSMHHTSIPRGAGIGFYLAVALVVPFFHWELFLSYGWIFASILMIFLVGVLDDYRNTSPYTKFAVIIVATSLLYINDLKIDTIGVFFGTPLSFSWFAVFFTIFAVSGFTNALNLIDGLDGLAGSISLVILTSFCIIGYVYNDIFMVVLSGTFIVSVLAFLLYNWYPATIFMGDSGSLTLGFVISVLAIKSLDYIATVSILFLAAVPILDTVIVMFRRKLEGGSAFDADRYHIHHLVRYMLHDSTPGTVLLLVCFQIVYSLCALCFERSMDQGVVFVLFLVHAVVLYQILNRIKKRQTDEDK